MYRKPRLKRAISILVMLCVIASNLMCLIANAEADSVDNLKEQTGNNADYAEIVFGDEVKTTNIKRWEYSSNDSSIAEYEGVKAARMGNGFIMDIEDEFMYDIPENNPVIITIQYFEEKAVNLYVHYHATGTNNTFASTGEGNTVHRNNPPIKVLEEQEWKTATLKFDDFRAKNGVQGWADLRIVNWNESSGNSGLSGKLIIHSVRIEYKKWQSPLRVTGEFDFDSVGNMYSDNSKVQIKLPMRNSSEDNSIKTDWTIKIYNANDFLVGVTDYSAELLPLEERTDTVLIDNPKEKGVYYAVPESKTAVMTQNGYGEAAEDEYWGKCDFSVSFMFEKNELNYNVGMNSHAGDHKTVARLLRNVGIGWVREGDTSYFLAKKQEDGKYRSQSGYSKLKPYKDEGIKTQMELRPTIYEDAHYFVAPTYKYPYGTSGGLPRNDEEIEHFSTVMADMIEDILPYVDNVEIFNEPEIADNNFVSGEQYAKIVKRVYEKIREFSSDLDISGIAMTNYYEHMQIPFYESGGLNYLNQYTIHRYDWTGAFNPYQYGYLYPAQHKELMKPYLKEDMPLWSTESGFMTEDMHKEGAKTGKKAWTSLYPEGVPRHVQARNYTLATAAYAGFDQYEKWFWHVATDFTDPTEREDSFGMFNTYKDNTNFGYTKYTAKPGAVAMAATNYFIRDDAVTKDISGDKDEGVWGFHFYTEKLGKDVLVIQAQYGKSGEKAFNLGCDSVEVYDMYGNFLGNMKSNGGVYAFNITEEPYYIVGNFGEFTQTQSTPEISPVVLVTDGVNGDVVSFKLKSNESKNYSITLTGLEVVENNGFLGNTATIKVKAPSWEYGTAYSRITVKDNEGNLCYFGEGEIQIKDPISVTLERIKLSDNQDTRWGVLARVRNNANTVCASGNFTITGPAFVADINRVRDFTELAPKSTISFLMKLPEMVNKEFVDLKTVTNLDTGFTKKLDDAIDFTTAKYAYKKPKIDGIQSQGEWNSSWFGVEKKEKISVEGASYMTMWEGKDDLSYTAQVMWDEDNFYFLAIVRDDVNYNNCKEGTYMNLWEGDSIQIGISDEVEVNSVLSNKFAEVGVGDENKLGIGTWCWNLRYEDSRIGKSLEHDEHAIKHYDGYTVYEWRIPWSELFYQNYVLDPSQKFRMAILVNDNDGPGGVGNGRIAMEYGGGIAKAKNVLEFARLEFVK